MKRTWSMLAVGLLVCTATVGRADETKGEKKPATSSPASAKPEALPVKPKALPVPGCAGSSCHPATPTCTSSCKQAPSCTSSCQRQAVCCDTRRDSLADVVVRHFSCKSTPVWDWLTYRALHRPGLAGCGSKCGGCHPPPLYTYFLDRCRGGCVEDASCDDTCCDPTRPAAHR